MYEQPWFLQINLYYRESKAIWKVLNNRFPILELLFDPKKEASRWKLAWQGFYIASQLNLQCN
jgi:glutathione S-transferase